MRDTHPDPIDIISIHLYDFDFCVDNIWFASCGPILEAAWLTRAYTVRDSG